MIPFNKPYLTGKETLYIEDAVKSGKISGNGKYTKLCQDFFEKKYGFKKCLLTTSCTDALEMAAILIDCKPDDEIIVPSYTFVSSALAFTRQGAKIVFVDSCKDSPNMDVNTITNLITSKTKAIVVVHYAGIAVDMIKVMNIAKQYGLIVVEDAAQSIDSFYRNKPLGSIGHLSTFSFHETKNIISGEGGMLVINDEPFSHRAEIIWEKGTNRASFFRGEINKYQWVDTGSSFLPSEIIAAFLWAQLESLEDIQKKRIEIWNRYFSGLECLVQKQHVKLPIIPNYATNNGHLFYILLNSLSNRTRLINYLKEKNVHTVFHYLSLHKSPFYLKNNDVKNLQNADYFTNHLLRLPIFYEITTREQNKIIEHIKHFFENEL